MGLQAQMYQPVSGTVTEFSDYACGCPDDQDIAGNVRGGRVKSDSPVLLK